MGCADNALAAFSQEPYFNADEDYESEWEFVDHTLNRVFGYGDVDEQIAELICRGPLGIDGLIHWLEVCLTWPTVSFDLLEGKICTLVPRYGSERGDYWTI
ncbi:hypothetical protein SCP_0508580 [Sparassis crispa]|uniref:Uncharacterized protein n=1 Tax=Sparassis crispa TaxID=139825 RepID=A0A401GNI4_9APHY|nr:hypothetical protein SCP_0508580 [Sparassis crispa]GBE83801.1 hypothetical protein SCP_0508580 [Sparassis crispa]